MQILEEPGFHRISFVLRTLTGIDSKGKRVSQTRLEYSITEAGMYRMGGKLLCAVTGGIILQ
jgi:hypothetical protein